MASKINWALLFVVIGGVIGLAFVFTTRSIAGTDEPQNITRVALIDQGWLIPPRSNTAADAPDGHVLDGRFEAELVDRVLPSSDEHPIEWSDQFRNARCGPGSSDRVNLALTPNV